MGSEVQALIMERKKKGRLLAVLPKCTHTGRQDYRSEYAGPVLLIQANIFKEDIGINLRMLPCTALAPSAASKGND